MRRRFTHYWFPYVLLMFFAFPLRAQNKTEFFQGQQVTAQEVLVKFRAANLERLAQVGAALDLDIVKAVGGIGVLLMHSRSKDVSTLLGVLARRDDVAYAEPNYVVTAINIPNDPRFTELYGLQNTGQPILGRPGVPGADISAVPAWDITTGSRANVVAVVDTGIDYTHPDLADNVWSAPADFTVTIGNLIITCVAGTHGFNAITNTCDPRDDNNHGTHVSGTIGAVGNNTLGVAGVNWTANIMGVKFLNDRGSGTTSDAINAVEFVVQAKAAFADGGDANARVLSNSWGGGGFSQALLDEINRANDNGMLFVAAAGNNHSNNDVVPFYPANYGAPSMIAVAATDNQDALAFFSNFGANTVHLGAPGVNVLSTVRGGGYSYLSGTSMATPHVSGAAALVLSVCDLDTATLKATLIDSADPIDSLSGITVSGGRLNVHAAILACSGGAPASAASVAPAVAP